MVRSRLPLASLLGLFGALLTLSPEVLMGIPEHLSDFAVTGPVEEKALAFAMKKYNQERGDSNYFKVVRLGQKVTAPKYRFLVELAETRCKKNPGKIIVYKNVQKCQLLPGNQKKLICYLEVFHDEVLFLLSMNVYFCF